MDLIADTSYLVGLWRGQPWATNYAASHPAKSLAIPWVVLGEFWHGALRANHDPKEINEFLSIGVHLMDASEIFPAYAKICAAISGTPPFPAIGQNDLWIAAIAVALDKPLLTRNRRHFDSIPDLKLVSLCN
ncbi:MAG: type II toxin-antitoxin system VapC family toxin [Luteolibacter sp.]